MRRGDSFHNLGEGGYTISHIRMLEPESDQIPEEPLDDTMDWFQQEEPVRRRPPRQLRSRTIGQVKWDSTHGGSNV